MKNLLTLICVATLTLTLSSCANKKNKQYTGVDGDFINGTPLPDRADGSAFFGNNVAKGEYAPVYFAFDSYEVSESEMGKIDKVASAQKDSSKTIIVAGFTDERGTEEYNRSLGERRAESVRQALIGKGLSANHIQTVSFGKEMPADSGSGDAAWAKNRRVEFGVVK
ncbi:MAG: OmpA family protein [Chthoniobacterales bacterium]